MKSERNTTIDFLRGTAVLLMIFIHTTAYYLSDKTTHLIWDYMHFVVPLFVFCSSYVYFIKKTDKPFTASYVLKRAERILKPYYLFLIAYFAYILFIKKTSITWDLVIKQIFLQGDRDLNWLVILFLTFVVIFPLIRFLEKKPFFLWIVASISFSSTIMLLFIKIPVHFRLYMWIPWSSIIFMTYFFIKSRYKKEFIFWTVWISIIIFFGSRAFLLFEDKTLVFTENKYPPNIYYLSYGTTLIFLLYGLHHSLGWGTLWLQKVFDFMSKYSYQIFFIHFFYLYILLEKLPYKQLGWVNLSLILILLTWATIGVWEKLKAIFSRY